MDTFNHTPRHHGRDKRAELFALLRLIMRQINGVAVRVDAERLTGREVEVSPSWLDYMIDAAEDISIAIEDSLARARALGMSDADHRAATNAMHATLFRPRFEALPPEPSDLR